MLSPYSFGAKAEYFLELLRRGYLPTEYSIHPSSSNNFGVQAPCVLDGNHSHRELTFLGSGSAQQVESDDGTIPLTKVVCMDSLSDASKQFELGTTIATKVAGSASAPYRVDMEIVDNRFSKGTVQQLLHVCPKINFGHEFLAYRTLLKPDHVYEVEKTYYRDQFQRKNHILAERQRREEMNEKFSKLRSIIPRSSKKDKASIVGNTIKYIIELENTIKQLQVSRTSLKRQHNSLARPRDPFLPKSSKEEKDFSTVRTATSTDHTASSAVSSADQMTEKMVEATRPPTEIEAQRIGDQAVIKVLCRRGRGLLLRVLCALDECKVDVLQSNVTTIGEIAVLFITVEMITGISASTDDLKSALHNAVTLE